MGPSVKQANIRVVLCDDHFIVREGLKRLMATTEDIEVVGEAGTGEDLLAQVLASNPDVVLMDLRLPGMDGVEATAAIKAQSPDVRVLALSTFVDDALVFSAIRAGASGYLVKDVAPERLFAAIRAVAAGHSPMSDEAIARVVQRIRGGGTADRTSAAFDRLTGQETVVLGLVAEGLTNQEIANSLCLSEKTVKSHLSNIYGKLDVHSRAQAVAVYLRSRPSWREEYVDR